MYTCVKIYPSSIVAKGRIVWVGRLKLCHKMVVFLDDCCKTRLPESNSVKLVFPAASPVVDVIALPNGVVFSLPSTSAKFPFLVMITIPDKSCTGSSLFAIHTIVSFESWLYQIPG